MRDRESSIEFRSFLATTAAGVQAYPSDRHGGATRASSQQRITRGWDMAFDVKKLTKLDRIIVGAAAVALLSTFLPWWGYTGPLHLYGTSIIGWNAGFTAW